MINTRIRKQLIEARDLTDRAWKLVDEVWAQVDNNDPVAKRRYYETALRLCDARATITDVLSEDDLPHPRTALGEV